MPPSADHVAQANPLKILRLTLTESVIYAPVHSQQLFLLDAGSIGVSVSLYFL